MWPTTPETGSLDSSLMLRRLFAKTFGATRGGYRSSGRMGC